MPAMQQKPVVPHPPEATHTERAHAAISRASLQHLQTRVQQPQFAAEPQKHLPP